MSAVPLGQIVTVAGATPVRVTSNLADPTRNVPCQSLMFQARPENAGLVYILMTGSATPGDDRTTRRYVVGILADPASATQGPFASLSIGLPMSPNALNAADFWIESASNGDGVIAVALVG